MRNVLERRPITVISISVSEHFNACAFKASKPQPKRNRTVRDLLIGSSKSEVPQKRKRTNIPDVPESIDSDLDLSDQEHCSK